MKVAIDKEIEATAEKNIFNQPVASCATAGSVMAQGKGKGESNMELEKGSRDTGRCLSASQSASFFLFGKHLSEILKLH